MDAISKKPMMIEKSGILKKEVVMKISSALKKDYGSIPSDLVSNSFAIQDVKISCDFEFAG